MKINKFLSFGLSLLATSFVVTSCTEDFEEINTNPNGPVTVPSDLVLPSILESTADLLYAPGRGGDMGANIVQQWGKVQYNDEERYDFRPAQINTIWNTLYASGLNDAKAMIRLAEEEGNEVNQGVGKVLQAYLYSILVECFGPIPYTDALKADEGITTPTYDTEEVVYQGIISLFDEGLTLLDGAGEISSTQDIMFGGDVMAWKKFANSLKFRTLMRISSAGVPNIDVSSQLQAIVSSGVHFTSNADNGILPYQDANPNANPIWNTIIFTTRSEYKVSSTLVGILEDLNDPRLPVYVAPSEEDGSFTGVPPGILNPTNNGYSYRSVSAIGELFLQPDYPGTFMDYSELMFLVAEAAQRGLITANAADAYNAAITANFERYGVELGGYLTNPDVAYSAANGLEKIGVQKWLALYCQGIEAWTEWRRTGFPDLEPAQDPIVGTEIPVRYTYPVDEQVLNSANYSEAVQLIGSDALNSKLIFVQ